MQAKKERKERGRNDDVRKERKKGRKKEGEGKKEKQRKRRNALQAVEKTGILKQRGTKTVKSERIMIKNRMQNNVQNWQSQKEGKKKGRKKETRKERKKKRNETSDIRVLPVCFQSSLCTGWARPWAAWPGRGAAAGSAHVARCGGLAVDPPLALRALPTAGRYQDSDDEDAKMMMMMMR